MKNIISLFVLSLLILSFQAHAAKIELEFSGQKQIVEFNPNDEIDMERAVNLWRKSDNRKYYVYSETGIFQVYDAPRDDAKKIEVGSWYQELNSRYQQSPRIAQLTWDKNKWFPKSPSLSTGWIKLDDPNLIYPDQLKPVKEWPIRYIANYINRAATEDSIKPKYDDYDRTQFDREGFILDNRTMKRKKLGENYLRIFFCRDFVKLVAVSPINLEVSVSMAGGMGLAFNLKQFLASPKLEYEDGRYLYIWGSFDDPVNPIFDKKNDNACVIDCKDRKRWEP